MTTNFPTSVDAFTNPTSADTLDNPPHDQQHADINDAMEAVQTSLLDGSPLKIDDANNRVGIGTTSPAYALDVSGDIRIVNSAPYLILRDTDTNADSRISAQSSQGSLFLDADYNNEVANTNIVFKSDGTEKARIDSSGNVGINDTTPSYKLDVNGDINSQTDVLVSGTSLPRGRLVHWSTTTDFTLSTSLVTYGTATFTLTESRHILAVLWYGEVDSFSTNPMNFYGYIGDTVTNDQIITALVSYTGSGGVSSLGQSRHLILPAGTYTWQFRGVTNTGTCRVDNASSVNRSTGYAVFDMGGA